VSAVRPSLVCERVRGQISLELDGELSELERRMLDAHLQRCPECRSFADDVVGFTSALREAPLESLEYPVVVRKPRRVGLGRVRAVGAAAVLAIAALGLAAELNRSASQPGVSIPIGSVVRFPSSAELERELAILQKAQEPPTSPRAPVL
jgi:anti-sigma factor RsiW